MSFSYLPAQLHCPRNHPHPDDNMYIGGYHVRSEYSHSHLYGDRHLFRHPTLQRTILSLKLPPSESPDTFFAPEKKQSFDRSYQDAGKNERIRCLEGIQCCRGTILSPLRFSSAICMVRHGPLCRVKVVAQRNSLCCTQIRKFCPT